MLYMSSNIDPLIHKRGAWGKQEPPHQYTANDKCTELWVFSWRRQIACNNVVGSPIRCQETGRQKTNPPLVFGWIAMNYFALLMGGPCWTGRTPCGFLIDLGRMATSGLFIMFSFLVHAISVFLFFMMKRCNSRCIWTSEAEGTTYTLLVYRHQTHIWAAVVFPTNWMAMQPY